MNAVSKKNPAFPAVWPPRWVDPQPVAATIGQPRNGRIPTVVSLKFFGAPALSVHVNASRQRIAWRAALLYARLRHSTARITDSSIAWVHTADDAVQQPVAV